MKFLTDGGIATVRGRQNESQAVCLATMAGEGEQEVRREVMEVRDEEKEQRLNQPKNLKALL